MAVRRFPMDHIRAREFYATLQRLQAERAAAPRAVRDTIQRTARDEWNSLVERSELLTAGVVEHLSQIVTNDITRDPKHAHAIAQLAVSLADALPGQNYPAITLAQVKALAWKELGKVLASLARYEEAIEAFGHAEHYVENFAALGHDRAVIRLNLAITYLDTERFTEGLGIVLGCKRVFQDHGETNLSVLASFYEGVALQRMKQYREARETYLLLFASATTIEKDTLAALHHAVGRCSTELGDFAAAEDNLSKGITLHNELGQPLAALKGEHGRGILLIRRGLYKRGIEHLRSVRHQYLKASLAEEAGLCGLEIVVAMLALRDSTAAEALARTIMNEFLAASLNARAITALGYLSEAIAERKASPELAVHIQAYVLSLRTAPEREFPGIPMSTDAE
jgi:tetratricopeptide (TPR) repeat protein